MTQSNAFNLLARSRWRTQVFRGRSQDSPLKKLSAPAWLLVGLCAAMLTGSVGAQTKFDKLVESLRPTGHVNDFAGILSPADRTALEQRCLELRKKTGSQLAVVIVNSLEGGDVDDFANRLFARWGIGEKEKSNGVLLLVALQDRKARIEVGYGLEPILPDALAGRVLNDQLFPAFRQQRYAEGLRAAVERMATIIERNEPAPPELRDGGELPMASKMFATIMLALFVCCGAFIVGAGIKVRTVSLVLFGLAFAGIPFLIGVAIASPIAPILHTPLAVILTLLGISVGGRRPPSSRHRGRTWTSGHGGGWVWPMYGGGGGWSSSTWNSGGFSGGFGGFGGGRSGGGGASGGW